MSQVEPNRAPGLADALRILAAVLLLAALAVAPLFYGATRPLPLEVAFALLVAGGAAWALSRAATGRYALPPVAMRCGVALLAVAAAAWLFFLAPPALPDFTRDHLARLAHRWPGSVVPRSFMIVLGWAGALVLALFALQDLARETRWRRALAGTMVLAGAAFALLGLVQNATRARGIYWDDSHRMPGAFFGTFFHHTSAGAYLNTVWPLGIALALTLIRQGAATSTQRSVIFASLVCATLALAAHTAHVSKLPQVLAALAFAVLAFWAGLWRVLGEVRGLRLATGIGCALAAVGVIYFGAARLDTIAGRWNDFKRSQFTPARAAAVVAPPPVETWPRLMRDDLFIPSDHRGYPLGDRGAAYAVALAAIEERPWFGWGPGGWTAAAAAHSADPFVRTFYLLVQFTHQDYLQTIVEWGFVGAAGWALLVPAALVQGGARLGPRPTHDFIGAGAVVALGAVLAQSLIDFPLQIPAVQLNAVALAALAWSVPSHSAASSVSNSFNHS